MTDPLQRLGERLWAFSFRFNDEVAGPAVKETMDHALRLARENASGKVLERDTGKLYRSIRTSVRASKGGVTGTLRAGNSKVLYARIHELGGTIEGNPRLRFKTDRGWFSPRRVQIPARPYLRPAIEEASEALPARMTARFLAALNRGT